MRERPERLDRYGFILVLQHPVTTEFGSGMAQINETIKAVHTLGMQTVWLWPNVDAGSDYISKGIRMYREREKPTHSSTPRSRSIRRGRCSPAASLGAFDSFI